MSRAASSQSKRDVVVEVVEEVEVAVEEEVPAVTRMHG